MFYKASLTKFKKMQMGRKISFCCTIAQLLAARNSNSLIYTEFLKSSSKNWIFSLQKSISKLVFAGYTDSKNPVWNWLKIQFVELDFPKLIFQKSSTDQQGVSLNVFVPAPMSMFCIALNSYSSFQYLYTNNLAAPTYFPVFDSASLSLPVCHGQSSTA